jgi:hypothetical protein
MSSLIFGFLFSSIFLGIGINKLLRSYRLRYKGNLVIGTVASVRHMTRGKVLTITFQTIRSHKVTFREAVGASFSGYGLETGNQIGVLYNPKKPTEASIYTPDSLWPLPLGFIGMGLFFLFFTIYALIMTK